MTSPAQPSPPADSHLDALGAALGRERALRDWMRAHGPLLLGFSGGVDSAYLAAVAVEVLGPAGVLAVIGRSASYPEAQWRTARAVAEQCAVPVLEVDTRELDDPDYVANPSDRCYFCKRELYRLCGDAARELGAAAVLDGFNADDRGDHRPGHRAAEEALVHSPLAEAGLTKLEIRRLSREMGLPTWDKPSMACLSSRIPYGSEVSAEKLAVIERAEDVLRGLGLRQFRVRHHDAIARLEVDPADFAELVRSPVRELVLARLQELGFKYVALDLQGYRTGSLNEVVFKSKVHTP